MSHLSKIPYFLGFTAFSSAYLFYDRYFLKPESLISCESSSSDPRNLNKNANRSFVFSSYDDANSDKKGWYTQSSPKGTTYLYCRDVYTTEKPLQAIDLGLKAEEILRIYQKRTEIVVVPHKGRPFYITIPFAFIPGPDYRRLPLYKQHEDVSRRQKDLIDFGNDTRDQGKRQKTEFRQFLIYGGGKLASTLARLLRETGFGGEVTVVYPKGCPLQNPEKLEKYQVSMKEGSIERFSINKNQVLLENGESLNYNSLCLALEEEKNEEQLKVVRFFFDFDKEQGMYADNLNKTNIENVFCLGDFCLYPDYKFAMRRKVKDELNLSRMAYYTSQNMIGRRVYFNIAKEL